MTAAGSDRRLLRRLAWTGSALAFGLIVLGGVVRITGSGMGCGEHWPNCNGEWFPPLDLPTLIEISHRWVAALVSVAIIAVAAVAWKRHRHERSLVVPATLALVLLIIQVLLGAITVKLTLPPWVVITHLANAMILLAVLLVTALRAGEPADQQRTPPRHAARPLVHLTAGLGFLVILFGAQTANFNAGLLCLGFPLCNGQLLPPANHLAGLHWTHRMLAFLFLGFTIVLVSRISRRGETEGWARVRTAAWWVLGLTVVQIGVAAAMILNLLPPALRVLHLLVGTAVWVSLVILEFRSSRAGDGSPEPAEAEPAEAAAAPTAPAGVHKPSLARDLVTLTKPRIISLLLVTTIAPMFITP
ncbi:MAG TPA: COX15/CtaA family protein, partial [Gemmatimonadales bacterium]|nr:COX15/CtaA family protein [Gemmatimonadales bacterium]